MSGTATQGPLTDAEKVDVRRFAGYPAFGAGANDDPFYRWSPEFVQLESHMANLQPSELTVCRMYVTELRATEQALFGARSNMDTEQAAVWKRNKDELDERRRDFNQKRRDLCQFMGVPCGPGLTRATGGVRLMI